MRYKTKKNVLLLIFFREAEKTAVSGGLPCLAPQDTENEQAMEKHEIVKRHTVQGKNNATWYGTQDAGDDFKKPSGCLLKIPDGGGIARRTNKKSRQRRLFFMRLQTALLQ